MNAGEYIQRVIASKMNILKFSDYFPYFEDIFYVLAKQDYRTFNKKEYFQYSFDEILLVVVERLY